MRRGRGVAGRPPGSVPSSWLGQALPNAHQCGACFYGEVPGSAIAFGFGPELRPTSGRGLERLLDQEWLRLPTACLLRSHGFPGEQLRPPLQLQPPRRYSARSVPERRPWRVGDLLLGSRGRHKSASARPLMRHLRFLAPLGMTEGARNVADWHALSDWNCPIGLVGALREAPLLLVDCSTAARSRGRRSPLQAAGEGPRRS